MKPSQNVPLTKAQRQALIVAAKRSLREYAYEKRTPALRNAVKRLEKVQDSEETDGQ